MTGSLPVWVLDLADAGVWSATVSVAWFVVQYTLSSPWWRDPVGRTVVAKDVALLVLLVPACVLLVDPSALNMTSSAVVEISSLALITAFMAWRSVVWWKIRPPRLRRRKPISRGELTSQEGKRP